MPRHSGTRGLSAARRRRLQALAEGAHHTKPEVVTSVTSNTHDDESPPPTAPVDVTPTTTPGVARSGEGIPVLSTAHDGDPRNPPRKPGGSTDNLPACRKNKQPENASPRSTRICEMQTLDLSERKAAHPLTPAGMGATEPYNNVTRCAQSRAESQQLAHAMMVSRAEAAHGSCTVTMKGEKRCMQAQLIEPDGHCLYRSMATTVAGTSAAWLYVKTAIAAALLHPTQALIQDLAGHSCDCAITKHANCPGHWDISNIPEMRRKLRIHAISMFTCTKCRPWIDEDACPCQGEATGVYGDMVAAITYTHVFDSNLEVAQYYGPASTAQEVQGVRHQLGRVGRQVTGRKTCILR